MFCLLFLSFTFLFSFSSTLSLLFYISLFLPLYSICLSTLSLTFPSSPHFLPPFLHVYLSYPSPLLFLFLSFVPSCLSFPLFILFGRMPPPPLLLPLTVPLSLFLLSLHDIKEDLGRHASSLIPPSTSFICLEVLPQVSLTHSLTHHHSRQIYNSTPSTFGCKTP